VPIPSSSYWLFGDNAGADLNYLSPTKPIRTYTVCILGTGSACMATNLLADTDVK